jgi:hypothetical protein
MQTKGETSHPLTPISRSRTCIHELCKKTVCIPWNKNGRGNFQQQTKVAIKTQIHTNDAFSKVMIVMMMMPKSMHFCLLRASASGARYVILHSKLDEENSIYAGFGQENSFGSA